MAESVDSQRNIPRNRWKAGGKTVGSGGIAHTSSTSSSLDWCWKSTWTGERRGARSKRLHGGEKRTSSITPWRATTTTAGGYAYAREGSTKCESSRVIKYPKARLRILYIGLDAIGFAPTGPTPVHRPLAHVKKPKCIETPREYELIRKTQRYINAFGHTCHCIITVAWRRSRRIDSTDFRQTILIILCPTIRASFDLVETTSAH